MPGYVKLRDRVHRRLESGDNVALLALTLERSRGELPFVHIRMAIEAAAEENLIARRGPGGNVTLRAGDGGVAAFQRIGCRDVFFHAEVRRFESVHGVTGGTLAAIGALLELAAMRIGRVAVAAFRERNRPLNSAPA